MFRKILLIAVAAAVSLSACGSSDPSSLDVITDGPGAGFGQFNTGGDKTFGFFICTNGGQVELESVEIVGTEGEIELMGGLVYTTSDMFVGATDGFPPEGIDEARTEPMEGAVVDISCLEPEGAERVQLLVGLDRTGPEGGVIEGFVVHTDSGDVDVEYRIILCGDELEFCEDLQPTENT